MAHAAFLRSQQASRFAIVSSIHGPCFLVELKSITHEPMPEIFFRHLRTNDTNITSDIVWGIF